MTIKKIFLNRRVFRVEEYDSNVPLAHSLPNHLFLGNENTIYCKVRGHENYWHYDMIARQKYCDCSVCNERAQIIYCVGV